MNAAEADTGEYGNPEPRWLNEAALPDSLEALLRFVAEDYLDELRAHVAYCNNWLAQHPEIPPGTNGLKRPGDRSIGMAAFSWRGVPIETAVMPYRFYLLQRIQAAAAAGAATERQAIEALLARTGLSEVLTLSILRRVERRNNLEERGASPCARRSNRQSNMK